ncbi:MAG: radical SAM protein [Thermoguttaceae bacterium]|nr:radical SAM protein [Thermoguttaceae bacterium]
MYLLSEWEDYQPRTVENFAPERIVWAKGSRRYPQFDGLIHKIIAVYPQAEVVFQEDTPHNQSSLIRRNISGKDEISSKLELHNMGKKTLVFSEHKSSLRFSSEEGNTCPNYWHFSLYGFCPYGCTYCYLAGTPGVYFAPSVKIFLNIDEILNRIHRQSEQNGVETSFYQGKLQDGLALDPLTGYSLRTIPFFAKEKYARQIILTKSADVENLLDLDHQKKSILSWTLSPPEISVLYEPNTPSVPSRLEAMKRCAKSGYPVRAVMMPVIPVENWLDLYADFLVQLLEEIPISRLTIGCICSYKSAFALQNQKLGGDNVITRNMDRIYTKQNDGRIRYPMKTRLDTYEHLVLAARKIRPDLEIGLCLESDEILHSTSEILLNNTTPGKCNCVL